MLLAKRKQYLYLVPKLRMRGDTPPLPQYVIMAWYVVKHRDMIYCTLPFTFRNWRTVQMYSKCVLCDFTWFIIIDLHSLQMQMY